VGASALVEECALLHSWEEGKTRRGAGVLPTLKTLDEESFQAMEPIMEQL
jgi:hypothetical protein